MKPLRYTLKPKLIPPEKPSLFFNFKVCLLLQLITFKLSFWLLHDKIDSCKRRSICLYYAFPFS